MDYNAMKLQFLVLYDKITNFDAPGYTDEEISILLSKGQENVVLDYYNPLKNNVREGFEETESRRKDLKELVKGTTLTVPSATQTGVLPNGSFFDLPADCMYVISEEVTTSSTDACKNAKRVRVKPITHDLYAINVNNPFKKPSIESYVWRLDYQGGKHELVTDGTFNVSQYHLRYIERLQPIITSAITVQGVVGPLSCKLDASLHNRIIDEAVRIATGVTEPEFYQIKTIEQQKSE